MPAPLAKGIVIGVTVLIAAGIAVYESPQVRRWVEDSRRKIALALHNLGDEIGPNQRRREQREDISMTEELGGEAEARRQRAREEIMRRASILEAKKNNGHRTTRSSTSFDSLVDREGNLKKSLSENREPDHSVGESTAIDTTFGAESTISSRRPDVMPDISRSISDMAPNMTEEQRRAIINTIDIDRLQIPLSSETSSHHPSESLVDLTPTSEFPDTEPSRSVQGDGNAEHPEAAEAGSDYFSVTSSVHTEDGEPDFYYAHPANGQNTSAAVDPESSVHFGDQNLQDISSTPSIASSMSHINGDPFDITPEGTISDIGSIRDGMHTPASWSEVGSVVSGSDGAHQ